MGGPHSDTSPNKKSPVKTGALVPEVGIEPTLPKKHEFESCASTNSATQAFGRGREVRKSFELIANPTWIS